MSIGTLAFLSLLPILPVAVFLVLLRWPASRAMPISYVVAGILAYFVWQVPGTQSESKYCRVYFRVGRNGSIESPAVETSSGNFVFDQAALRAVVQASPLPPLPGGFADDYLGVHFSFAYEQE